MKNFIITCKMCGSENCVYVPHYGNIPDKNSVDLLEYDILTGYEIQCMDCENSEFEE